MNRPKKGLVQFNSDIAFCAFRYALGRMSYIVSTVTEYLIRNWELMPLDLQTLIHKEIDVAEQKDQLGMECDKAEWMKVRQLSLTPKR
jgi:hypothetical protein